MHIHSLEQWRHSHRYQVVNTHGEQRTRWEILLTLVMMVIEISAGYIYGSMALLADGWHMGTHAIALGITAFAYYFARHQAGNPVYSFGTGKIGVLGGFTSAIVLAVVALLMGVESLERFLSPRAIKFNEAILVAVIGLIVNIVSALLLQEKHHHGHDHGHDHHNHQKFQDHNLRAAYFHVIADALTSVLAIVALLCGKSFGWVWMDPLMGMVGACIIIKWAHGLLFDTGKILLDRDVNQEAVEEIQSFIESDSDNRVSDIDVWRVGPQHLYAILSIVTHFPKPPDYYKKLLSEYEEIVHVTIEVHQAESEPCLVSNPV